MKNKMKCNIVQKVKDILSYFIAELHKEHEGCTNINLEKTRKRKERPEAIPDTEFSYKILADNINMLLQKREWSQNDLSACARVAEGTIGKCCNPSNTKSLYIHTINRIALAFDVSVPYLLSESPKNCSLDDITIEDVKIQIRKIENELKKLQKLIESE